MDFIIIFESDPPIYTYSYDAHVFEKAKLIINTRTHMYTKDGRNWYSILLGKV